MVTFKDVNKEIRFTKILSGVIAIAVFVLVSAAFLIALSNVNTIKEKTNSVQDVAYPVAAAAGHVETELVELESLIGFMGLVPTDELVSDTVAQINDVMPQLHENIELISDIGPDAEKISPDATFEGQALYEQYGQLDGYISEYLVEIGNTDGVGGVDEGSDGGTFATQTLLPQIADMLEVNQSIMDDSDAAVSALNIEINSACAHTIFASSVLLAAAFLALVALVVVTRGSRRREVVLYEELEQALDEAQKANSAKSVFLSSMSHDIRTPLNAIMGLTSIAKMSEDDEKRDWCLEKIAISSKQLLGLVNDVLDMSEIESGKIALTCKRVCLSELLTEFESMMEPQVRAKGVAFECRAVDLLHEFVIADDLRLNQVLLNLGSNAVKYTARGGRVTVGMYEGPCEACERADMRPFEARVAECVTNDEGWTCVCVGELSELRDGWTVIRFEVEDTGKGMDAAFMQEVFEPYARERRETTNYSQGAGLGMSIVKNVVTVMHGRMCVKSAAGRGSRFTVEIPLEIAEACDEVAVTHLTGANQRKSQNAEVAQVNADEESAENLNVSCGALQGRVLLVEDDALNSEIAVELISACGVEVETAFDGEQALKRVIEVEPGYFGCVFMDCQMPKMGGLEATRRIRQFEAENDLPRLPIVAMTANAFNDDRLRALESGMDDFISKPISLSELERAMREFLG
jgi:signal transduction histidine kinase/CheY-like chemotaxis protein